MSFPKKGKFFPRNGGEGEVRRYAAEIATVLQQSLGPTRARIKVAASWTGANERTVKNWFSGRYGPSGEYLVALMRHSDDVLRVVLELSGREELLLAVKIDEAGQILQELLQAISKLEH